MKTSLISDKKFPLLGFIFVIGTFFTIVANSFLTEGMFLDGLLYSTIAHNLYNGNGSFWHMQVLNANDSFYAHPPLAMGIQSLLYHIFGDAYWVDKLYSMSTIGVSAFLIILLWKELGFSLKQAWLVWLFWLITPLVSWCATNNLLENTMGVFILLSVLLYLKSLKKHRLIFCFLSGIMLFLAFLCKGFTGLYPLALPLLYWLCMRNKSFGSACIDVLIIILGLILPFGILIISSPDAADFFEKYWQIQIVESLGGEQMEGSRFYILLQMITELIIPAICLGVILLYFWKKKLLVFDTHHSKLALTYILLAFCGVLPIMISLKQRSFYIMTVFPFFAIAMAALVVPTITTWTMPSTGRKWASWITASIVEVALILNIYFCGKIGRDLEILPDEHLLMKEIPTHSTVNIEEDLSTNYSFIFYFARYKDVDLEKGNQEQMKIVPTENKNKYLEEGYELVNTGATNYSLLRKKEPNN